MKTIALLSVFVCCSTSLLLAADANPREAVKSAAEKLAEKANYSWKTTYDFGEGSGSVEGRTEKGGPTLLELGWQDNTIEAVLKGGKGAVKTDEGWKSLRELTAENSGQPNREQFVARMLQDYKLPPAQAEEVVSKAKELKVADGVYSGDLTQEGVKELLRFGRRGGNGPEISGAKGSAKFWLKDGALAKYEFRTAGTVGDRDVDITTTVEITKVGTTQVTVPEAAAKKLE